jgi:Domain of unknown function (DUF1707)
MATTDDLRVSDAEREAVAAELREHYAQGRLTMEDFQQRLDAAFAARIRRDLDAVTHDLPAVRPPSTPLPVHTGRRGGGSGYGRSWFSPIGALLVVLVGLVLYADAFAGMRMAWPGRLGILIAVFAVLRGMLRRLLGGRCGRR